MNYDVVFIGGGPGGYGAAIKASSNGLRVALIEKNKVGGTCLHVGCIPTKTLIASSAVVQTINSAKKFGIDIDCYSIDYKRIKERKDEIVNKLHNSVITLLKTHGVDLFYGEGSFLSRNKIKVIGKENAIIDVKNVIIATGSTTSSINSLDVDGKKIHDSTTILEMKSLPKKLTILGGGYIGCEFASLYSELGVKITIVEAMPTIISTHSKNISRTLAESLKKKGVDVRCNVKMDGCKTNDEFVELTLNDGSTIKSDVLLISVGRKPYTHGLNLNAVGLSTDEHGFISVNEKMETTIDGIYAIGDVTGVSMLAHVASHQGSVAVDQIIGCNTIINYDAIPAVIFTHPEIATVGLNLERATSRGYKAASAIVPFTALSKAIVDGYTDGYGEIIYEPTTGRILGASIIGNDAGNLIAEMVLAINCELTVESIFDTMHAHPTLSEGWGEAAAILINSITR